MSKSLLLTLIFFAPTVDSMRAQNPSQFQVAKISYQQALQRGQNPEQARQHYLDRLITIRAGWPRGQPEQDFKALDAEVRLYPLPKTAGTAKLSRLLVGRWRSPRHDYLYRANGALIMLPEDTYTREDRWYIKGNRLFTGPTDVHTIVLLDRKNFVFDDGGEFLFYEKHLLP